MAGTSTFVTMRRVIGMLGMSIAALLFCLPSASSASQLGRAASAPPKPPPVRGLGLARADRPDRQVSAAPSASPVAVPAGTWQPLGPAPVGPPFLVSGGYYGGVNAGRITSIATLPSGPHSGRIVAGSAGGGIWTSDDGGATWTARSDSAADLAIGSVADDPSTPDHLIAGTGEANNSGDSFPGAGILVSTDGGSSWTLQNPGGIFTGLDVAQVAIDPSNSNHEFAATTSGLFVTTNGGTSWALPTDASYAAVDGSITAVVIDPVTPTTVYLGGGAATVAKSSDGGVHWAAANTGIAGPGSLTSIGLAASSPSTLYTSVGGIGAVALYKSVNGGTSWSPLANTPDYTGQAYAYGSGTGEQGWYDNVVQVDPLNANHLIAGGIAIVESTNGGTSWSNINGQVFFGAGTNKIHPDQHALAFRPDGKVWVGDDGGVFLYDPSTGAVDNANGNLNITQFYSGFNAVGNVVLAGSQDNGSARTSSASVGAWTGVFSGDGGPSAITPNQTSLQFIEADSGLFVTSDGFATSLHDITPPQYGLFTPPMIVVPNTAAPSSPTVFYGGVDLWRTTNPTAASPTWTKVTSIGHYVSAIAASPTNPLVVYVGFTDGTIEVSTDGGSSFTPLPAAPPTVPFVTGLSVNPANPKAITASFSFNNTRYSAAFPHVAQYLYSATPASGSWTVITGNLPTTVAVSHVVYDSGALLAATDNGVYATGAPAGGSTSWTRVGAGLPNVQVQDLFVQGNQIYAVTHGRGAWRLTATSTPPPTVSSFTPTSAGVGMTVTVNGSNLTGATAVTFNGTSASTFTVVSAAEITVTVPNGASTGKIAATTPSGTGTSSGSFTVLPSPSISSFSPGSGKAASSVVINGSNFSGVTGVAFHGAAAAFTVNSAVKITATVPAAATSGTLTVTTKGGVATSGATFTVIPPAPTVSSFTPTSAHVGALVTINGNFLTGATAVKFNGTSAISFTVVSATKITATVPGGATTGKISITTPGGTVTSVGTFTVLP